MAIVITFVNSEGQSVNKPREMDTLSMVEAGTVYVGGGEGNRTLGPLHAKQVLSR